MSEQEDLKKLDSLGLMSRLQKTKIEHLLNENDGVMTTCVIGIDTETGHAEIDRHGRVVWKK